jgi:phage shock protein PspC (stress-responsive transcriptional regulator)
MTSPPQEPSPEQPSERPRLTRSSQDRVIGGVAGGLARHLRIDPILVRLGFVLLTFIGGAGLLAYLALLAFVPSDDGQPLGGSANNRAATIAGTVVLAIAAVIFLGPPVVLLGPGLLVLALIAVAVVFVVRATGTRDGSQDPARTIARVGLGIIIVLGALGGGIGVALAAALGGGVVIGILTIVTGLALVATAFLGGARWLVLPALVLALPLTIVAAGNIDLDGGIGQRDYRPHDVSELRPSYKVGIGQLRVDLRDVDLPAGRTDLKLDVGLGEAQIRVPEGVCVSTDAQIGAGDAEVFDHTNDGIDVDYAEGGRAAPTQPHLYVNADIVAGHLDIARDGWDTGDPFDIGRADESAGCA